MLPRGQGAILFTGASASVKGYAQSAPFAMGKFALRGLAQSMARELSPQGIHVAHFVIDGGIKSARRPAEPDKPDSLLDPDAIAASYLACAQTAAQRLDAGTRTAAVGGEILKRFTAQQPDHVSQFTNGCAGPALSAFVVQTGRAEHQRRAVRNRPE